MAADKRADIYNAIMADLNFSLPINYQRGAGDTYFSGKMIAKLARIVLIAEEFGSINQTMIAVAKSHLQVTS